VIQEGLCYLKLVEFMAWIFYLTVLDKNRCLAVQQWFSELY
jgi:hypothetical protein